jgi:hypothetical protein
MVAAAAAPAERAQREQRAQPALRVLFVGNSLTYFPDMPLIVEAIARATGGPPVVTRSMTRGGFSLGDHLDLGLTARLLLILGRWDYVVLQQGPSSLPNSRVILRRDVARFADLMSARSSRPAVYMVWPERARIDVFPDVIESYRLAAEDVGAPLLAVGSAWQAAWTLDPTLELYGPDDFHPTPLGSYLAALVIYEGLTGSSAIGAPGTLTLRNGRRINIPAAQAALVQQAAVMARQP